MTEAITGQDAPRQQKPQRLPCKRKIPTEDGGTRRCGKTAKHVWVIGTFGRHADVLCEPCIEQVRATGYKVQYQIQGDAPVSLEQELG